MVLGIAVATLPLLLTTWREERTRREALAVAGAGAGVGAGGGGTPVARIDEREELRAAA